MPFGFCTLAVLLEHGALSKAAERTVYRPTSHVKLFLLTPRLQFLSASMLSVHIVYKGPNVLDAMLVILLLPLAVLVSPNVFSSSSSFLPPLAPSQARRDSVLADHRRRRHRQGVHHPGAVRPDQSGAGCQGKLFRHRFPPRSQVRHLKWARALFCVRGGGGWPRL